MQCIKDRGHHLIIYIFIHNLGKEEPFNTNGRVGGFTSK